MCTFVHRYLGFVVKTKVTKKGRIPSEEADLNFRDAKKFYRTPMKFYQTIIDDTKGLSYREIITCILIRFKFIPSEIAVLTNNSYQQITNLKSTINKKLFDKKGAKTLDSNLMSLK